MTSIRTLSSGQRLLPAALAAAFLCIGFTVLQDLLRAAVHRSAFYLSESLLFNLFWVIFLPLFYVQYKAISKFGAPGLLHYILYIAVACCVHLVAFAALVFLLSCFLFDHTYSFEGNLRYSLSEDSGKLLLGYGAFAFFLTQRQRPQVKKVVPDTASPTFPTHLTVTRGGRYIQVDLSEVYYLRAASPYITLHLNTVDYLYSDTLKSMAEKLNPSQFIRVHKSTIINRAHVRSYHSRQNGDYDITMADGTEIRLSRNYLPAFRKLISNR